MRHILKELDEEIETVQIYEDNQVFILWTEVDGNHTKHVHVRCNIALEANERRIIDLECCLSKDMAADILTKPLGPQKYRRMLRMMPVSHVERGSE